MTITEFLEARIVEDEAAANDRPSWAHIHASGCYYYDYSLSAGWFCDCDEDGSGSRRLLAECAAKRAIIGLADDGLATEVDRRDASALGASLMHSDIIRALAAVYKDHPDYRQEWAL